VLRTPADSMLLFFVYWALNSGFQACQAGALLPEPVLQPFCLYFGLRRAPLILAGITGLHHHTWLCNCTRSSSHGQGLCQWEDPGRQDCVDAGVSLHWVGAGFGLWELPPAVCP
jgi:hypothetical protein